jgi:hypothetical protein
MGFVALRGEAQKRSRSATERAEPGLGSDEWGAEARRAAEKIQQRMEPSLPH